MSEDYWDGATWVYQTDITSDAMDAANHTYIIVPGAGNEIEILYGYLFNGDISARAGSVRIDDGGNRLGSLIDDANNLAAGARRYFPVAANDSDDKPSGPSGRIFLSGTMRVFARVDAVSVTEDSAFSIVCRIRGGIPTVTEGASAGVPVISINKEQVF